MQDPEITTLMVNLKRLRNIWLAGVLIIVLLAFWGHLQGFWIFWLFFWSILSLGTLLYLVLNQIRCPTCNVQLLSKRAIRSPDKCYNCGRPLNGPPPSRRDVAEQLFERYKDERAAKTKWKAIQAETANFDTHKLRKSSNGQLVFKPTLTSYFGDVVFLVLGIITYSLAYLFTFNKGFWQLLTLFPLLFVGFGVYAIYQSMTPIRIDRKHQRFVLGWGADDWVSLHEIKAVQLLPYRRVRLTNTQIILVLADHSRKSVVTYYHQDKAIKAAQQLASTLDLPLWNGLDTSE